MFFALENLVTFVPLYDLANHLWRPLILTPQVLPSSFYVISIWKRIYSHPFPFPFYFHEFYRPLSSNSLFSFSLIPPVPRAHFHGDLPSIKPIMASGPVTYPYTVVIRPLFLYHEDHLPRPLLPWMVRPGARRGRNNTNSSNKHTRANTSAYRARSNNYSSRWFVRPRGGTPERDQVASASI